MNCAIPPSSDLLETCSFLPCREPNHNQSCCCKHVFQGGTKVCRMAFTHCTHLFFLSASLFYILLPETLCILAALSSAKVLQVLVQNNISTANFRVTCLFCSLSSSPPHPPPANRVAVSYNNYINTRQFLTAVLFTLNIGLFSTTITQQYLIRTGAW